jgi:hypothetical protein
MCKRWLDGETPALAIYSLMSAKAHRLKIQTRATTLTTNFTESILSKSENGWRNQAFNNLLSL